MTWVVTTDSNTCRIYHYQKKPAEIKLIKEIKHPENKLKNVDLVSDGPGHYEASTSGRGTYSPHMDEKQVLIDNFSREIAKELDHGRNSQKYDNLIIIASPHMSGLLNQHLNKNVKDLISHNIHKDTLHLSDHELLEFIKAHAKFPNGGE